MQAVLRSVTQLIATLLVVAVVLGYGAAWFGPLDVLGHFRLHLALMCGPAIFMALMVRGWGAAWRAAVAGLLAIAGLSPVWEAPPATAKGPELTILTANLHTRNPQIDQMVEALRSADADVLVTNETTKAVLGGTNPLSDLYPYRLSLSTTGSILRTVIWSKYPMRDGDLFLEDAVEPTGAVAVVQLPDGKEVSILGLHLAHAWPGNQSRQIAVLGEITADLPRPLIVLGDFNATPWSHALVRAQALTGTTRIPGYRVSWRGAYPSPFGDVPAVLGHAIDHILLSPELGVQRTMVLDIPGSDHDAVGAVVRLPSA